MKAVKIGLAALGGILILVTLNAARKTAHEVEMAGGWAAYKELLAQKQTTRRWLHSLSPSERALPWYDSAWDFSHELDAIGVQYRTWECADPSTCPPRYGEKDKAQFRVGKDGRAIVSVHCYETFKGDSAKGAQETLEETAEAVEEGAARFFDQVHLDGGLKSWDPAIESDREYSLLMGKSCWVLVNEPLDFGLAQRLEKSAGSQRITLGAR